MKRNSWYPSRGNDQIACLENFRIKLPDHGEAVGLTPAQIAAGVADCRWLIYVLQSWLVAVRAWALSCTDAAADAQTGDGADLMELPVFTPPTLPTGVVAVNTGALTRFFALVQVIKNSSGYNETIGTDLGIVGTEQGAPDFSVLKPVLKLSVAPGIVNVDWNWGGCAAFLDMIELQVDRGDGKGWVFLATDTTPGYTDSFPQPSVLTKWKYRAIYRAEDRQVGLWSNEESITIGG